jgi:hypothetical protein
VSVAPFPGATTPTMRALAAVRQFFRGHPDGAFIASYVGKVAGTTPCETLQALVWLIEVSEIRVCVSEGGLCWTFMARHAR